MAEAATDGRLILIGRDTLARGEDVSTEGACFTFTRSVMEGGGFSAALLGVLACFTDDGITTGGFGVARLENLGNGGVSGGAERDLDVLLISMTQTLMPEEEFLLGGAQIQIAGG